MSVPTPITGDLLYTDVEDDLRASVRALLDRQSPWDAVLKRLDVTDPADAVDTALWSRLATEVGVASLAVGEERGGAGASWREAAVVAEELGRAAAPVPFLGSAVVATAALLECTPTSDVDAFVARLARGELTAALAVPAGTGPGVAPAVTVEAREFDGWEGTLHGTVRGVLDAATADILLVPTGDGLYVVEAGGASAGRDVVVSLDMTRPLSDLTFDGAEGRRLAEDASAPVGYALTVGAAVLASEQLGLAERCLGDTIDYLRTRYQFGRQLASYQALKHRLADLWVDLTQARAVARYAARCAADASPDLPIAAAVAAAHCSRVAVLAAQEGLQLHGGIGFTWEHPAHLYLKRAKASATILGSADHHRTVLAGLVDLPA